MKTMMAATDGIPLNFGFTGKGNDSGAKMQAQKDVVEAGAIGLKLHEDWGTTPETIDRALTIGDEYDVQVSLEWWSSRYLSSTFPVSGRSTSTLIP
jgi:urease